MARQRPRRRESPSPAALPPAAPPIRWRVAILLVAGLIAYSNSFSGPFVFDDRVAIVENAQIRDVWALDEVLSPRRELPTAGRPLVNFSFAVNYALGGLNVEGYHVVNLGLHLLCGLLVFGLVRRTLELPSVKDRMGARAVSLAFATALLWTVHPLNTEAVDYLTQRTEVMMALCYLLTLYAAVRAAGSPRRLWSATAVASCAAGMLCKESMVTAPVAVVLHDAVFVSGSVRRALGDRWRLYAGLAASWGVLAAVMWPGPRIHSVGFSSGVEPWTYLLNQAVMITRYLRLAMWPRALVANYGWPQALTLGDVLPYALLVTTLLGATLVAMMRRPHWGFLGAWFFLTLAPTSTFVPIATEVGAERRMYLPLVAIVALAVLGASRLARRVPVRGSVVLATVAALLTLGTLTRNREYRSELMLARTILERYPTSVAHHIMGVDLLLAGEREAGIRELRKAIPGAPRAHYSLGVELLKDENSREAIEQFEAFLREQPDVLEAVSARQLLAEALIRERRWDEAIEQARKVLTMYPSERRRLDTVGLLAQAFLGAENFEEAIAHDREYVRARPDDVPALTRLGIALSATGRTREAVASFRRAAAVAPGEADTQRNLTIALTDEGELEAAVAPAKRWAELRPADAEAHRVLGRVLGLLGRFDEARAPLERALELDPGDADVRRILRGLPPATSRENRGRVP